MAPYTELFDKNLRQNRIDFTLSLLDKLMVFVAERNLEDLSDFVNIGLTSNY